MDNDLDPLEARFYEELADSVREGIPSFDDFKAWSKQKLPDRRRLLEFSYDYLLLARISVLGKEHLETQLELLGRTCDRMAEIINDAGLLDRLLESEEFAEYKTGRPPGRDEGLRIIRSALKKHAESAIREKRAKEGKAGGDKRGNSTADRDNQIWKSFLRLQKTKPKREITEALVEQYGESPENIRRILRKKKQT